MPSSSHTILFDCERMKHSHTGLFHFCLQLGHHLVEVNKNKDRKFGFYVPPNLKELFSPHRIVEQNSLHKFNLLPTRGVDIWHNTYQSSMYFPRRKRVKVVYTIHDLNLIYESHRSEVKKIKYLADIKRKIKRADHVVLISNFVLDEVQKHVGLGGKKYSVIYNGCNINAAQKVEEPAQKPKRPFLFTIGTIMEKKNFHTLPCLLKGNDFDLVIAGIPANEGYKSLVVEEAKKWGVLDRIIFTNAVTEGEKYWYYQNCEAFLFPSIAEGFGLPVVEAMAFGKPVILSTSTSLPEIGGEDAFYFPNFEAEEMQKTLERCLREFSPQTAQKMKERSEFFSWKRSAEQYHEVYNSIL